MGNDGGSIPTRRELVKEAARNPTNTELKETQHEQQEYFWTTDPVSREPLARPVVSDSSGKLYSKATILEYLVEGRRRDDFQSTTQGPVKSLKDVVEVKFEVDTETSNKKDDTSKTEIWKCPVTGDRLGPGSKAVYLVPCGHAFSGSAIKEVSGEKCLTCDTEYASNDIIPIIPTSTTDIARLSLRIKTLQGKGLAHSLKKASGEKKRKKKEDVAETQENGVTSTNGSATEKINNISAASVTAKVLQEQDNAKRQKRENKNIRSLFSSQDQNKPLAKNSDFMTRGFSVPSESRR